MAAWQVFFLVLKLGVTSEKTTLYTDNDGGGTLTVVTRDPKTTHNPNFPMLVVLVSPILGLQLNNG